MSWAEIACNAIAYKGKINIETANPIVGGNFKKTTWLILI